MFICVLRILRKKKVRKQLRDTFGKYRKAGVNDDPVVQELVAGGRQKVFTRKKK